ncbi:MAG: glucokinase [Gaiellaceae bacterium]|nr:glucokinase [Gaiellaceae bacterium]
MNRAGRFPEASVVGIDVGGTKIAAGLVDAESGRVLAREELPTLPERGGKAVLSDCAALVHALGAGARDVPVGIGLCEVVDLQGRPVSAETVDWRGLDVAAGIAAPWVVLESDVRAAALAEARFGAGVGRSPFLYVVVGTGASVCLVVDGEPYPGARGRAIVLGAPPVEWIASGRGLAGRAGAERAEAVLADPAWTSLVDEAAAALGQVLAVLANALDPAVLVIGGGLGGARAFRERVADVVRSSIAYPPVPELEIIGSELGPDGGLIGAALAALQPR